MGGSGVWGQEVMPPHPLITMHEARTIVQYMLAAKETAVSTLPLEGTYTPTVPDDDNGRGSLVLRAVYTDKGARDLPPQTAEATTMLRSPKLGAATADVQKGVTVATGRGTSGSVIPHATGYIGFKNIDLTGIKKAELTATTAARSGNIGGIVEIRLGSPTGALLGQAVVPMPVDPQAEGAAAGGGRPPLSVDLKAVTGVHDLYLVFKNEKATPIQPLMTFASVTLL
jgi:cytochrome c